MSVLSAENLVKTYRRRRVVNGASLEVGQGQIVGLLGPNGAGKTTIFYMLMGLVQPDSGKVLIDDENITGLPMYLRARNGVSYLAQEPSVFRKLTAAENIMAILETMKISPDEQNKRLNMLMSELGISHLADNRAETLSGGERRRVEIARSLVIDPKFMLLDEPFVGIDPIAVTDIQNIISQLKRRNIGILITDHNVRETLEITDRAYIIYEGKILLSGTGKELANDELAKKFYLGERFSL